MRTHEGSLVTTKYVDSHPNIALRTRRGRAAAQAEAEREATPFNELVFDSREHYERSKKMLSRDILHERCINFQGQPDFMEERLGGTRMNEIPITEDALNSFLPVSTPPPSKEEDAYEQNLVRKNTGMLNMDLVLATIALPGMRWDSYKPKSGRVDNAILTPLARGWQKMIVSNVQHHKWYKHGASDQRLPFSVLISRMAAENEVPTFPEDQYIFIEGKDMFCSFGDWQGEKKKARKGDIPQPPRAPIPPPISQTQTLLLQRNPLHLHLAETSCKIFSRSSADGKKFLGTPGT
ncbi:hypothetical protein PIB30_079736 [Stylosanthes scabra]|uniref:Uncharacterized protein n=1 Tax=Stylosanthes scabra TaxID=79078 RepID=A0ABU6XP95_9FABA|nr:hypothetical protein [Stylosanthes scabra]